MAVKLNSDLCPGDHACPAVDACPVTALVQEGTAAPTVDEGGCIDCGVCVDACIGGALEI